jgi:hypothetical protein
MNQNDLPVDFEPTNAALMVISTQYGFFGIDPLADTWVEGAVVQHLWKGHKDIPVLCSRGSGIEIWFVSLEWLIRLHPKLTWLVSARTALVDLVREEGFCAD